MSMVSDAPHRYHHNIRTYCLLSSSPPRARTIQEDSRFDVVADIDNLLPFSGPYCAGRGVTFAVGVVEVVDRRQFHLCSY
jgi:hypothetical protein